MQKQQLQSNSQELMELIQEYGSINDIPNKKLKLIGYIRNELGQLLNEKIMKKEKEAKKKAKKIKERKDAENKVKLEEKKERNPFGIIKVKLQEKNLQGRRVSFELIEKFEELINHHLNLHDDWESMELIIPKNKAFWVIHKEMFEYISDNYVIEDEFTELKQGFYCTTIINIINNYFSKSLSEIEISSHIVEDEDDYENSYITSDKSIEIYQELERMKGILTDTPVFKKKILKYIQKDFADEYGLSPEDELFKKHKGNNIETIEDYIVYHIKDFLEYFGLEDIYTKLQKDKTFEEVYQKLQSIQNSDFPFGQELYDIKKKLKTANIEEKKKLSKENKELSKELKYQKNIIQGLIESLSQEELISIYFKRLIKQLQSYLISKNQESKESLIYLDGRVDFTYDQNPGEVSGDCTKGKPLAFTDPNIPIFNIKVFDEKKLHIGNIYLLSTETDSGEKVWHLEAIQIPGKIEWNDGIKIIINAIGVEAKKKNINMITINTNLTHMSNYDYIQDGISNHIEEAQLNIETIIVPNVDEAEYSAFQGDGKVYVLWENK